MTRPSSLRKCLYNNIIFIIYLFIFFFWGGGGVALSINKPSKYMQMSRAEILQTDLNTFPSRVMRELDKISTCKHLPFHGHFYNSHNILSLRCSDIAIDVGHS